MSDKRGKLAKAYYYGLIILDLAWWFFRDSANATLEERIRRESARQAN